MYRFLCFVGLLTILSLSFCITACDTGSKQPAGVVSMDKLKAQGKCPVEIVKASAASTVGNTATGTNPTVTLSIKNVSDKKITLINWAVINADKNGKLCKSWKDESGFAEIGGLEPGETMEGKSFSSDPETSKVVVVIKDMAYETKQSGFDIALKWTNKNYDSEIQKAKESFK